MKKGVDYPGVSIVFLCHDGEGNYLFNKRSVHCRDEHGCWDPGGGGLDFGMTVEETLKKEISEEYGTEILSHEFLGYQDVHRVLEGQATHWLALNFRVLVDRSKVHNGEPRKFDEIGWFRLDNLPQPLHSHAPAALEKYKEKLL